ncbi:hypothetical protein RHMOL_Rhmol01G0146200 [Rhododendron molle]|uniref:Uncharacterized protein n=1 Tax=Rhododendron molle TaxID=49168 RepID=A0ACC0Q2V9_RHOML|nr:hypothetical protein RHMOL_Rhmol01G0146200 [Rhododendron molle]
MNLGGEPGGSGTDLSPSSTVNLNLGGRGRGSSVGGVVDGSREGVARFQVTICVMYRGWSTPMIGDGFTEDIQLGLQFVLPSPELVNVSN